MTDPVRKAVESYTGTPLYRCPWRAFYDPLVLRVMQAMPFFESGQLGFALPDPSHRLVQGIAFYQSASNRMTAQQMDLERDERERARKRAASDESRGSARVIHRTVR